MFIKSPVALSQHLISEAQTTNSNIEHINKHKSTTRLKRLSKENHVDHSQIDHIIGMMPTSGIKRSTAKAATKPTADD